MLKGHLNWKSIEKLSVNICGMKLQVNTKKKDMQ